MTTNPVFEAGARFAQWWIGELAACLPAAARGLLRRGKNVISIEIDRDRAIVTHFRGQARLALGSVDTSGASMREQREAVDRMLDTSSVQSAEVVVYLPRAQVLRQTIELPAAAAENLHEVVAFEMDRHTPFRADDVYFDCRITHSDAKRGLIDVDLAVVPRDVADTAVALARGWSLAPARLGIADEPAAAADQMNLLPLSDRRTPGELSRRLSVVFGCCAVVLAALMVYLPLWQKQDLQARTEALLARARAEALEVDAIKAQVAARVASGQFLVDRKAQRPSLTALMDEVTRLLPDNTYIVQLALRERQVTLSGNSAKASALIAELEQSGLLSEVSFSSPITLDRRIGLERFNLTATIVDGRAR